MKVGVTAPGARRRVVGEGSVGEDADADDRCSDENADQEYGELEQCLFQTPASPVRAFGAAEQAGSLPLDLHQNDQYKDNRHYDLKNVHY